MKSLSIFLVLTFALFAPCVAADDDNEILEALRGYADATDRRDAEALEGRLHEKHRHFVLMRGQLRAFEREQYLQLLRDGKIGGQKRAFRLVSLDVTQGETAMAKVELTNDANFRFTHYFSLLKVSGEWKIFDIWTSVRAGGQ